MNLEALGGRKFLLAIISLVAGLLTHSLSPKGLSTEVVAMIVGIIGTFSVSNTIATIKAPGSQEPTEIAPEPTGGVQPNYSLTIGQDGSIVDYSEQLKSQAALLEQIAITVSNTQQMLVNAMQAGQQNK